VAALMVDGVHLGEHLMVVALAITTDGTKVPIGLYDGDTENTTVVTALLADLVDRGLDTTGGVLFVLDGAKALATAVRRVFGSAALVQRCTVHKRRNVADHLPETEAELIDRKLVRAFTHPDPDLGLRAAPRPGHLPRAKPPLRCGQHPGGAGGDVHRPPAGSIRGPRADLDHDEPHRVHDLHNSDHPAQRQELEGLSDGPAVDRCRPPRLMGMMASRSLGMGCR
jgi:hypothetical protein